MSVAYFIVLDNEDVDFDTFVNGKHVAHFANEMLAFCNMHGLKPLEDFFSLDAGEFMDEFDDMDIPDQDMQWFDAEVGIEWIDELIETLASESSEAWVEPVIEDLNEYKSVLEQARQIGAKWHFELDI